MKKILVLLLLLTAAALLFYRFRMDEYARADFIKWLNGALGFRNGGAAGR